MAETSASADTNGDPADYLAPTPYLDADHPAVVAFARRAVGDAAGETDRAVRLYYAVRDEIRYDPYVPLTDPAQYRASAVLAAGRGYCVSKAVLLTAAARAAGLPARLAFADVRNHLCTPRLRSLMGTDVFIFHGITEFRLGGKWVKATPAFNLALCERFGVKPLEFDGRDDSILHPYDNAGRRHMEYVGDRGSFADVPFEEIVAGLRAAYPRLVDGDGGSGGDFAAEAAGETDGSPAP